MTLSGIDTKVLKAAFVSAMTAVQGDKHQEEHIAEQWGLFLDKLLENAK